MKRFKKPRCNDDLCYFTYMIRLRRTNSDVIPEETYSALIDSFLSQENLIEKIKTHILYYVRQLNETPSHIVDNIDVDLFKRKVLGINR